MLFPISVSLWILVTAKPKVFFFFDLVSIPIVTALLLKIFSPKKAILTNLHTDIDYKQIKKNLPKNVIPAFDGLSLDL